MRQLSFLLLFFLVSTAFAQEAHDIKGVVANRWKHRGIPFANVLLEDHTTGNMLAGGVTDMDGNYHFKQVVCDSVRVCVSFLGYYPDTLVVGFDEGQEVYMLDSILLRRQRNQLEELNIVAERPMIIQSAGKTTLNVNEAMSGSGESAIELLKYLPSASTDEEDNVLLRGAPATVMIDGVETDLANALDALPIGMIDKVEVITNPSAKYSSQNGSGIINIVLKTDKKKGANGRVNVAIGTPERMQAGGNVILNHKKWTFFTNADYSHYSNAMTGLSERRSLMDESVMYSKSSSDRIYDKVNARQGIKYQLGKSTSLRYDMNYRFDKNAYEGRGGMEKIEADSILRTKNANTSEGGSERRYFSNALDLRTTFKDESQLAVIAKLENQDKLAPYDKDILYYDVASNEPKNYYLNQQRTNPENINSFRFQADYEKDISSKLKLESGLMYLQRTSSATSDFVKTKYTFDPSDSSIVVDPDSSQIYDYQVDELSPSVYTMLVYENDNWSFSGGLRYEYVHYDASAGDSVMSIDHHNALPSFQISRKFSSTFTLGIAGASRTKMPKYKQLSPVEVYNGLYSKSVGNPMLSPERITNLELNLNRQFEKHNLTSSLFYKRFEDMIGRQQYYVTEDGNEVLVRQFENIGEVDQWGFDMNMNSRLPYDIRLKTNVLVLAQDIRSEFQGVPQAINDVSWSAKIVANQTLWEHYRWQLTAGYTSPSKNINGENYSVFYTNIGLSKKVFKKKGSLSLQVNDVFDTVDRERLNNTSIKHEQYSYTKFTTRKVLLSFAYRFNTMGNKKKK